VARLAGLPAAVIDRAGEILANLESHEYDPSGKPRLARGNAPETGEPAQLTLFVPPEQVVASLIRDADLEQMTPLAALNLLHSLRSRLV
jgi:DNA mismatch repair protein MutS